MTTTPPAGTTPTNSTGTTGTTGSTPSQNPPLQ
jgi:hypothetical protein